MTPTLVLASSFTCSKLQIAFAVQERVSAADICSVSPERIVCQLTESDQVSTIHSASGKVRNESVLTKRNNFEVKWLCPDVGILQLREMLAGEVNLVHLISTKEGCSYNRAAEIVNGMVVDRCQDLSLAAAELRHHADSNKDSSSLDSENAEKYILLCTNFVSASHEFHQRSARFHKY